jgi:hypothetical protein
MPWTPTDGNKDTALNILCAQALNGQELLASRYRSFTLSNLAASTHWIWQWENQRVSLSFVTIKRIAWSKSKHKYPAQGISLSSELSQLISLDLGTLLNRE